MKNSSFQLLCQADNPGVTLKYTLQNENVSDWRTPEFRWIYSDWTHCTPSCGGGKNIHLALDAGTKFATEKLFDFSDFIYEVFELLNPMDTDDTLWCHIKIFYRFHSTCNTEETFHHEITNHSLPNSKKILRHLTCIVMLTPYIC